MFDVILTLNQASYDEESVNEIEFVICNALTEALQIIICEVS